MSFLKAHRRVFLLSLQLGLLVCGAVLHALGAAAQDYNWFVFRNLCLYLCAAVFCLSDFGKRVLLLTFLCAMFVFLSCRPLIDFFRGEVWWEGFQRPDLLFALNSVALSVLTLYAGAVLYVLWEKRRKAAERLPVPPVGNTACADSVRLAALGLYIVTMGFYLYCEFDKLAFMRGRSYPDFYLLYKPSYPGLFGTVSYCMPFALCAYLAALPKKKPALAVLVVYLLSAVPQLVIGIRNPFILNALFVFLYCFLRDRLGGEERWLGRREYWAIAAVLPFVCVGLSVLNYTREGTAQESGSLLETFIDLFYRQGASFWTLCVGHSVLSCLPGAKRTFTFGSMIDYVLYGRIGRKLWGTAPLPSGNSAELAARSHRLSQAISFAGHGGYLEGRGLGSSYLLEVFADYGNAGIVIFSLLMGIFLLYCMDAIRKGWFSRVLILLFLSSLFFVPRAEATDWFAFLIHIYFWLVILACQLGGRVLAWGKIWRKG